MELRDKVALITGGSKGLGLALARALGQRGAKLALIARNAPALQAAANRLSAEGIRVHAIAADIADKNAVYPIVGQIQATLGPIDVLVHNASSLGHVPLRALLDTDCEVLEQTLATNVVGPFRLTKAVAPAMVLRGQGAIVHVSSDAALNAYPRWGAYGTSKLALDHLARHFAAELTGTGVSVLSIDPGEMDTDMHRDAMPEADLSTLAQANEVAERIARLLEGRLSTRHGQRVVVQELEADA